MRIAVVGGGISGVASSWELSLSHQVTLFESQQVGGKLKTSEFEGRMVDEGPDAFITRSPEALQFCIELGIESELVGPVARRAALWTDNGIRPLPESFMLGVPSSLLGMARTGILSARGIMRASLDLVLPRRNAANPSVYDIVAGRFGKEVADRLVDPLVGGIHAGSIRNLGAEEVTPELLSLNQTARSLLLASRRRRSTRTLPASLPAFLAPRTGMQRIVDAATDALERRNVRIDRRTVTSLRVDNGGSVRLDDGNEPFDAAVVALPAAEAARVLNDFVSSDDIASWLPDALRSIPTASVAMATVKLDGNCFPPSLSGFLVPKADRRLMTACSFASNKWPHWASSGSSVARISAGRFDDTRIASLDDAALADRLIDELSTALHRRISPSAVRVTRWSDAFPQYVPGHSSLVSGIENSLSKLAPRVVLAGCSYKGAGIPACIASGRRAARALDSQLLNLSA